MTEKPGTVNADDVKKWAGAAVAVIGLLAALTWGVPYYIKTQVRAEVTAELEAQAVSTELVSINSIAANNQATLNAITTQLESMEARMIRRQELFEQYLERQANR